MLIEIVKATGEREPFDVSKLELSLRKARAPEAIITKVVKHIIETTPTGATTHEIYKNAFEFLHTQEHRVAIRYSLKRAIMDLGPSGFPFEQLIAELLMAHGYTVETDQIVKGHCASHEVDIVAYKENQLIMGEAKFHNNPGLTTDLKVALYVYARTEDLTGMEFTFGNVSRKLTASWLVTNTKFTTSAIQYAMCRNMTMIGWNYPLEGSLQDMIEETQMHPLTCLTTLSETNKKALLDKKVVLCKAIRENNTFLSDLGLSFEVIDSVNQEIDLLYQGD